MISDYINIKRVFKRKINNRLNNQINEVIKLEMDMKTLSKELNKKGEKQMKKIGILTNGGDAPGLNTVIRAIVKTAEENGIEAYGFLDGFKGLLENKYIKLDSLGNAKHLLYTGGTFIGTSNATNVFNLRVMDKNGNVEYKDMSWLCVENLKKEDFDCVFILGGDGSLKSARDFSTLGVNFIGIPKTIDNDVAHTDRCFGFSTAVQTATNAMDQLRTTAESHERIMVLEVMGRYAGWIALETAIAGGADAVLLPEKEYDLQKVADKIIENKKKGKKFSLVVVSEGAKEKGKDLIIKRKVDVGKGLDNIKLGGAGDYVASRLEELTKIESRNTTLGYVQRGGTPIAEDRILSTMYGVEAMNLALKGIFNVLVVMKDNKLSYVTLEDVVGENKEIGAASGNTKESNIRTVTMDHPLIETAKSIGICIRIV